MRFFTRPWVEGWRDARLTRQAEMEVMVAKSANTGSLEARTMEAQRTLERWRFERRPWVWAVCLRVYRVWVWPRFFNDYLWMRREVRRRQASAAFNQRIVLGR